MSRHKPIDPNKGFDHVMEIDGDAKSSLPKTARQEIDDILKNYSKKVVAAMITEVDHWYGMRPTVLVKPSDVKKKLADMNKKCRALREHLENSIGDTWTAIRAAAQDADGIGFEGWDFSADDLKRDGWFYSPMYVVDELLRQVACLEGLSTYAQQRHIPKGGRMPSFESRFWATHVAQACVRNKIKVTSYDDGEYFRLLEVIFRYAIPESGETAYMRFGREIAKQHSQTTKIG